jgi:hypothetical protein
MQRSPHIQIEVIIGVVREIVETERRKAVVVYAPKNRRRRVSADQPDREKAN